MKLHTLELHKLKSVCIYISAKISFYMQTLQHRLNEK